MLRWQSAGVRHRVLIGLGAVGLVAAASALALLLLSSGGNSQQLVKRTPTPTSSKALRSNSPTPSANTVGRRAPLGDSYRMIIEKIGVDAPVETYGLDENAVPIVPTGKDAGKVVVWYDFSAPPGMGSNAVFAGHVTWNGPAVFKKLDALAVGDTIRLHGANGAEAVYRVTSTVAFDADDPRALDAMMPTDQDTVTLITCTGTYYRTDDPTFGGAYTQRIFVQARLVGLDG